MEVSSFIIIKLDAMTLFNLYFNYIEMKQKRKFNITEFSPSRHMNYVVILTSVTAR